MTTIEQLKTIIPGKTYPRYVKITEKNGKVVDFYLNSFFVGMYCAIHFNGSVTPVAQVGDHDNKKFCTSLKKDLKKALTRGATVFIGHVANCKLNP